MATFWYIGFCVVVVAVILFSVFRSNPSVAARRGWLVFGTVLMVFAVALFFYSDFLEQDYYKEYLARIEQEKLEREQERLQELIAEAEKEPKLKEKEEEKPFAAVGRGRLEEDLSEKYTRIEIGSVRADNELSEKYSVAKLIDGDTSTSWQDGEDGLGIETEISFDFMEPQEIKYMTIWVGNGISEEKYRQNARPGYLTISLDTTKGVRRCGCSLDDINDYQSVEFLYAGSVIGVSLVIDEVVEGTTFDDTCITEIEFYGTKPE